MANRKAKDVLSDTLQTVLGELGLNKATSNEVAGKLLTDLESAMGGLAPKENIDFGFLKITADRRDARTARNPKTGESVDVPAKTVLKLKVGSRLKDTVETNE